MKLELEHLAPYLPYGLKCQYEGIVNGGEISKKRKEYKKENEPFVNWSYFRDIDEIKGLKIAPLKSIRVYKKYWVATCGIYNKGQKGFYSGIGIKPILRPLSDLAKEIEVDGKKFVPIKKLFNIAYESVYDHPFEGSYIESIELSENLSIKAKEDNWSYGFSIELPYCFRFSTNGDFLNIPNFSMYQKLWEWHFDIFDLHSNNLCIYYDELK